MSKLKTKQTYFVKCLYGDHLIEYILRATNVNTNITDNDVNRISYNLGGIEANWCEVCNKKTAQQKVAYSLEQS
jgi:hypothetical protein